MAWSILQFSGGEIIRLATEIEKAGKAFYDAAAEKVDDPEISALFKALGGEEERHLADFQALGRKLQNNSFTPNESYAGEYGEYLKAIVDNHVFNIDNVDSLVERVVVAREALAIALRFEKDSIMIFQEFEKLVDDSGREVVRKLIDQEKEHIRVLAHLNKVKW
ncbi:MAG: ferritin family protein [Peptococcaceae bacterium]|nr:ferritin family protein [Peptococcaceae bacterium]